MNTLIHNLPVPTTAFVGRRREIAQAERLLTESCCLTLTGPGGCGKSRLALQIAARQVSEYPDGVWFVELVTASNLQALLRNMGGALGIRDKPKETALAGVINHLRQKQLLLVLDNCEHLLHECRSLVTALTDHCPSLRLLITSRELLGAAGGTLLAVPPLAVPAEGPSPAVSDLARCEAVQLFVQRAAAAFPPFTLTDRNAPAVAEICRRLDGIPLALELAAARSALLSPEEILARLSHRFRLLTGGSEVPPRHRTMRAAVEWTHDALTPDERVLWRRLSVFPESFPLEAAETVCSGSGIGREQVSDLAASLCARSILVAGDQAPERRMRMLETLRAYGREQLDASGEGDRIIRGHMEWCVALAESADARLIGPEQALWIDRLEREHGSMRAALRQALREGERETALRLVCALSRFWLIRGHIREARGWLQAVVENRRERTALVARALNSAGVMEELAGDLETAQRWLGEALEIGTELGDHMGLAAIYNSLGRVARRSEEPDRAQRLYEQGLDHARLADVPYWVAGSLNNLGVLAQQRGDLRCATIHYAEALPHIRACGDQRGLALTLNNLGAVSIIQRDLGRAQVTLSEALVLCRSLGDRRAEAITLCNLADVARDQRDLPQAFARYRQSLAILQEGHPDLCVGVLEGLAGAEMTAGKHERAARLYAAADAMRRELKSTTTVINRADTERYLTMLSELVPAAQLRRYRGEGEAMSWAESIAYALEAEPQPQPTASGPRQPHVPGALTQRETEVALLVGQGLSVRDIGERLHISARTVGKHEEKIRAKLKLPSRVALAAWASRNLTGHPCS